MQRYGMTRQDLDDRIARQDGVCLICREPLEPHEHKGSRTHVDHDPRFGKRPEAATVVVRGVLCHLHNQGLGKFQDDPELLERAAEYVRTQGRFDNWAPGIGAGLL